MLTKEQIIEKINYQIVVDCYSEYEVAQGWLCSMQDDLEFPFKATAKFKKRDGASELKQVTIIGLEADDHFMGTDFDLEMTDGDYVKNIKYSKLSNIVASEPTMELFQCWDHWVKEY